MLYNYLIFFLGFYSWNYQGDNCIDNLLLRKKININVSEPITNRKKLIGVFEEVCSISPSLNLYLDNINLNRLNLYTRIKIYLYNLYSLLILSLLCIQPIYLITQIILDNNNSIEYFETLLLNITSPINYIWAKYYFSTNHFIYFTSSCKTTCSSFISVLLILTCVSILVNVLLIESIYNNYYYIHKIYKPYGIILLILEWIYSRLTFGLTCSCFTIVFLKHIKDMKNFIRKILINEIDMEDSYCLTKLIRHISVLRHTVEISIIFYNSIFSILTITGGLSLSLLIRKIINKYNNLNSTNDLNIENETLLILEPNTIIFTEHEKYLIQAYVIYLMCQIGFFGIIIYYSHIKHNLIRIVQSSSFITRFLSRYSLTKLKNKCENTDKKIYLSKMLLCIEEENATSIDWMILDRLTSNNWMDFSIMGISTQDGSLVKKIVALSSLLYIFWGSP